MPFINGVAPAMAAVTFKNERRVPSSGVMIEQALLASGGRNLAGCVQKYVMQ
jgi:hypothetical protein